MTNAPTEPQQPRPRPGLQRDREVISGRTVLYAIAAIVIIVSGALLIVSGVLTRGH